MQKIKSSSPDFTEGINCVFCTTKKQKPFIVLAYLHRFFLINYAEPLQFTVTLILPPSAIPMKPIIAHLFILSTLFKKNHLCETIS